MSDLATALEFSLADNPAIELKFEALKNLQAMKTKSLMSQIDTLTKEVTRLKVLSKDSRRAEMVQALRNKMRDYDLVVEVLKDELEKESEYDRQEINDLIIRKTTGGPKRFRPATREELEKKIVEYEKKIKKLESKVSSSQNIIGNNNGNNSENNSQSGFNRKGLTRAPSSKLSLGLAEEVDIGESAKLSMLDEEIKQLKSAVDLKDGTIQSMREEVSRLRSRNAELASDEEVASFKDQKIEELRIANDNATKDLEDLTRQLAEAREESNIIQEAANTDASMLQKELQSIYGQCEHLLSQNTLLLKQLGETELDSTVDVSTQSIRLIQQKLDHSEEKLRLQESKIKELEGHRERSDKLREELREKNEIIRELKRGVNELQRRN